MRGRRTLRVSASRTVHDDHPRLGARPPQDADCGPAKPPLKVAHIIHSLGPGGAESVLVDLAGVARGAGLDLLVIALSPTPLPVHAEALRTRGVPVVELGLPRWDPRAVNGAVAAVRSFGAQLLHTHLKHADLVGAATGRLLGLPTVSTLHVVEDAPPGTVARWKRALGLVVRRRFAARTIALSSAQREWYRQLSGSDDGVVVLPNGVADPGTTPSAVRARLRADLRVPDGGALVVSAALMRPEKGHDLLLDAVSKLSTHAPVVALAGDGPLRLQLETRVAADPVLRQRVRFLGYRDDVSALLGAADLVLHTSRADALPTTLMQALAVGSPAVATHVGGIPDIIDGATGVLVPPEPVAIAAAVHRLLQDDDLRSRLGVAGRARFLERFEASVWAARLRALYDSVLQTPVQPDADPPTL